MKRNFQFFRTLSISVGFSIVISLILAALSFYGTRAENVTVPFSSILFYTLPRFLLWGLFFPFILKTIEKYNQRSILNTLIKVGIGIFVLFLHQFLFSMIVWLGVVSFENAETTFSKQFWSSLLSGLYFNLLLYSVIFFISQAIVRNKKLAEAEESSKALKTELVAAQLQALKMQLQPHFLFNTLNSISSLVLKNPTQAQTMIAKLGDFLRLTLDFNESQMVLLREELRFLRSYLEIEQIRFSEKLEVIFNVKEDVMNAIVPHLALQPIVENSVKHGISQLTEGGKIEIIAQKLEDKLQLKVKDTGPGKSAAVESNKTGLANIKARLRYLYGENFSFEMEGKEGDGMTVTMTIPLNFEFSAVEKND